MPKIRIYDAQVKPQGVLNIRRATQADFDFGAGFREAGRQAGKLAAYWERRAEEDAALWANKAAAQARIDWTKRSEELESTAEPGAPEHTKKLLEEFDEAASESLAAAPDRKSRMRLAAQLSSVRQSLAMRGVAFESRALARKKRTDVETSLDDLINTVRADPQQREAVLRQAGEVVGTAFGNTETGRELSASAAENIHNAAIHSHLDQVKDVQSAQRWVTELEQSDTWKKGLGKEQYSRAINRARGLVKSFTDRENRLFLDGVNDAIAEMQLGVGIENLSDWKSLVNQKVADPRVRARLADSLDRAARFGKQYQIMENASAAERRAILQDFDERVKTPTEPGKEGGRKDIAEYRAAVRAAQQLEQRLKQDAAAEIMRSDPALRENWEQLQKELAAEAQGQPGLSAELAEDYAAAMISEQRRRRGAYAPTDLLPATYLESIREDLALVEKDAAGAQKAFERLRAESAIWGRNWPLVVDQLRRKKVVTGAMAVAAGLTSTDRRAVGQSLMRAALIGQKELEKPFRAAGDKDQILTLYDKVEAELAPFAETLRPQVGGPGQVSNYREATSVLALYYMNTQGLNPAQAAERAAAELFGRDYEFVDTYRVPAGVDADGVSAGTVAMLYDLEDVPLDVPVAGIAANPDQAKADFIEALREQAVWITNSDETGLQLGFREMNGEITAVLIRDANGELRPLEYSWEALQEAGAAEMIDDDPDELF